MMLSVCMAAFNGEKTIARQLQSILPQLGDGDEVIVSDDGSTDLTRDIVACIARGDARVRLIDGPRRGIIANFEHAVEASRGDLVFLSDQDDVWREGKVRKVRDVFLKQTCAVVLHDARVVDGAGKTLQESYFCLRRSAPGLLRNILRNSYMGCCMAFRGDMKRCILPIPRDIGMHDQWIGIVCEKMGGSVFLKEPLIDYYRHGDNASPEGHLPMMRMLEYRLALLRALRERRGRA